MSRHRRLRSRLAGSAFMRQAPLHRAFLICLATVEQNDASLLVQLDPQLVNAQAWTTAGDDSCSVDENVSDTLFPPFRL